MAKILTNLNVAEMNEKDRAKYISKLKYSLNMAPEVRERGFLDLAKFYLNKEDYFKAGYCLESTGKFDEACQSYFGAAYNKILEGRIGEKTLSQVEELVDIAMTHPKHLDKTRVAYVMNFFDRNKREGDSEANRIVHRLGVIYKAKSSSKKSKIKNKG